MSTQSVNLGPVQHSIPSAIYTSFGPWIGENLIFSLAGYTLLQVVGIAIVVFLFGSGCAVCWSKI